MDLRIAQRKARPPHSQYAVLSCSRQAACCSKSRFNIPKLHGSHGFICSTMPPLSTICDKNRPLSHACTSLNRWKTMMMNTNHTSETVTVTVSFCDKLDAPVQTNLPFLSALLPLPFCSCFFDALLTFPAVTSCCRSVCAGVSFSSDASCTAFSCSTSLSASLT